VTVVVHCVYVWVIVDFLFLSSKLILGCLCLAHITSIKVVSKRLPHKSLFTSPTLLKSLSGDADLVGKNTSSSASNSSPLRGSDKNKLTNIPPEKKMEWGPTCSVTHGVYSGKINYQLQTLGYQQLVDKKLVLSTVG
jgi:hypothetical protein